MLVVDFQGKILVVGFGKLEYWKIGNWNRFLQIAPKHSKFKIQHLKFLLDLGWLDLREDIC